MFFQLSNLKQDVRGSDSAGRVSHAGGDQQQGHRAGAGGQHSQVNEPAGERLFRSHLLGQERADADLGAE